jgi:hypothetical protein
LSGYQIVVKNQPSFQSIHIKNRPSVTQGDILKNRSSVTQSDTWNKILDFKVCNLRYMVHKKQKQNSSIQMLILK